MRELLLLMGFVVTGCSLSSALPYCNVGDGKAIPTYDSALHAGEDPERNVLRVSIIPANDQELLGRAIVMAALGMDSWQAWPARMQVCGTAIERRAIDASKIDSIRCTNGMTEVFY